MRQGPARGALGRAPKQSREWACSNSTGEHTDLVAAAVRQKRVALYLRVSTSDQRVDNQRRELLRVSKRNNWQVVSTFVDEGISGAKGRRDRAGYDSLLKSITRREVDLIAAWSVDRLGRSLTDLLSFLGEIHSKGCDLYLHQQGLDTSTPAGRAMFQMMGVFAEFERAIIRERVLAGLSRAKAEGRKLGRPKLAPEIEAQIIALRKTQMGILKIARTLGTGVSAVQRVLNDKATVP